MPIFTQAVTPSTSVAAAHARFQQEIATWIAACMARYERSPATDVHDQGTYTTSWEPYIRATGDAAALTFLKATRDRIRDHFEATGQWRHGYWTMQEAHHGTEHYELFLGMLLRLDPDDAETKRQLLDAAEHMGNWCDDVPPWFDYATNRFHSFFFGTDAVRTEPGDEFNRTDHLRGANICLLAYAASDDRRYLDFAARYAGAWADAILAGPALPIGLMPDRPLFHGGDTHEAVYRAFVGEASAPATSVDRAENFLASDAVNTFLRLWRLTGDTRFRHAAERLLDVLSDELAHRVDAAVVRVDIHDHQARLPSGHHTDVRVRPSTPPCRHHLWVGTGVAKPVGCARMLARRRASTAMTRAAAVGRGVTREDGPALACVLQRSRPGSTAAHQSAPTSGSAEAASAATGAASRATGSTSQ